MDTGKAQYPCQDDLGLDPPFDQVFIGCCEDVKSTTTSTSSSTTATVTTKATTPTTIAQPLSTRDSFSCKA